MTRIHLHIQLAPPEVEIACNLVRKDGGHEKVFAFLDTGAEVSLFPRYLMDIAEIEDPVEIVLEQGGLGTITIPAIQAVVQLAFEDASGHVTTFQRTLVSFADTAVALIGFDGVLDRAVLHIDMPQQSGWLELN